MIFGGDFSHHGLKKPKKMDNFIHLNVNLKKKTQNRKKSQMFQSHKIEKKLINIMCICILKVYFKKFIQT
jgi:hypothetical protein